MSSVAKKEAITLILSPLELEAHGIPRRDDASRIVILVRLAQIVNNTLRKSAKRDATIEIQRRTEKKTGAEENRPDLHNLIHCDPFQTGSFECIARGHCFFRWMEALPKRESRTNKQVHNYTMTLGRVLPADLSLDEFKRVLMKPEDRDFDKPVFIRGPFHAETRLELEGDVQFRFAIDRLYIKSPSLITFRVWE
ncbi:MAG: hypothetical protein LQ349_004331 [Xanthoria aureola]|nr:MAG: hypothetical protein LQ349_004331 [Xanthoria aureola]